MNSAPDSAGRRIGGYTQWWRPAFALLIIALAYFYRLDKPLLWGDEAETGIGARSVLRHGYPIAYDGRNVSLFENGVGLNGNLVYKKIPWMQFYVGALSILIFGNTTLGLRILFVLCGVLSFFPIYAILKSRLKYPATLTVLTLISPQVILFQRNARYYPLLILLYAVLIWHVLRDFKSSRKHFLSALLIFFLFFFTHPFAAACSALALVVFCFFFRREVLASYFIACGTGFAAWFVWNLILGPALSDEALPISLIRTHFIIWFKAFCAGLWTTIVDMDVVGCFPVLLWTVLLAVLLMRGGNALRNLFRERLYAFVFLNILVQAAASAALFSFDTEARYSLLRYEPHLLVFGLVATFMVLNAVIAGKSLYLIVSIIAVAFNLLAFSFWAKPLSRRVPASWLIPVYSEIFRPRDNVWDLVISRMENEAQNASGRDLVIATVPRWTLEVSIFYLGDRCLIHPAVREPAVECMQALQRIMGEKAFYNLFDRPVWLVDFVNVLKTAPAGYGLVGVIPTYQPKPDDGSRPELTRHVFPRSNVVGNVRLFRLQQ